MKRLLGEILVESGLSAERLKKTLDLQKKRGGRIGALLIRLGLVTEAEVLKALGAQLGLPFEADLGEIDRELALKLPITYAKNAVAIPLRRENGAILVATSEPLTISTIDDLPVLLNAGISLRLAPSETILDTLNRLHSEDMNKAEDTAQEMEEEDAMVRGVRFLVDDTGRRTAVQIDLKKQARLWEDFYDRALAEQRASEPREPLATVKKRVLAQLPRFQERSAEMSTGCAGCE